MVCHFRISSEARNIWNPVKTTNALNWTPYNIPLRVCGMTLGGTTKPMSLYLE